MNIGKLLKAGIKGARGEFDKDVMLEGLSQMGIEAEGGDPITEAEVLPALEAMVQPGRTYLTAVLKFKTGAKAELFVSVDKGKL
ncbi:MAG TPA: hypothetical protein VMU24_02370 [Candidatus Acidoferrales bacterium]|nr:hypothetical protein [Candidatus Acidoferrales bacterium]